MSIVPCIREFNQVNLNIVEMIEKAEFSVGSVSYYRGGYIFEFDRVSGTRPLLHEKQFRLLRDPRENQWFIEEFVAADKDQSKVWKYIASAPCVGIETVGFYAPVEQLIEELKQ